MNWRNGVVTELNDVLQTEEIYLNATHGKVASKDDLKKCFPGK